MFSPSVNKHFPQGTSPFSSASKARKVQVGVPQAILNQFEHAKEIMNKSPYTDIATKRGCLRNGIIPMEQKLADLQKDYTDLYDAYEALHKTHQLLQATTSKLITDVEEDYRLNLAKVELFVRIANATNISDLPVVSDPAPSTEAAAVDALDSSSASPSSVAPKKEADVTRSESPVSEAKASFDLPPKTDARVRFEDNFPDFYDPRCNLADSFSIALDLKNSV